MKKNRVSKRKEVAPKPKENTITKEEIQKMTAVDLIKHIETTA